MTHPYRRGFDKNIQEQSTAWLCDPLPISILSLKSILIDRTIPFEEAAGSPIGQNDLFIAAHAIALGLLLVTNNMGEFSRVRSLKLENWLG